MENFSYNNISLNYKKNNYIYTNNNINLELLRSDYYNMILKLFNETIETYFDVSIFNKKKPIKRTLSNILSNFIFSQYRMKKNYNDIFLPEITEIKFIENVLEDYLVINNKSSDMIKVFSKVFLKKYKELYTDFLIKKIDLGKKKIKLYIKTIFIKNSEFIKMSPFDIINKDYEVILYQGRYKQLKDKFTTRNPFIKNQFNEILYCILLRYNTLGSNNNQLAVSPEIMKNFKHEYNFSFESFASAINATSDYFCSAYPDLEKYFGSLGNFFDCSFIEGTYNFNPPFQEDIINIGIEKIFDNINIAKNNNKKLTFIITIPVWDKEGKKLFGIIDDYKDLPIIKKIKNSIYLKKFDAISKEEFDYHDHLYNLTKNVTIQNTYMIILSSK